jgi:hypothetical protein
MDGLRLSELETFESTHSVRCLICDRKFDSDPEKGRGEITVDQFAREIDDNLRRLDGTRRFGNTRTPKKGRRKTERRDEEVWCCYSF